jgi:hypothetical protein
MKRALLLMVSGLLCINGFSQTDTLYTGLHSQLDTAAVVPVGGSAAGCATGCNSHSWTGFAQLYTQNGPSFGGWTVKGCISVWVGRIDNPGSNNVTLSVWNVDSSYAVQLDVNGTDSVTGFPKGAPTTTQALSYSSIAANLNTTSLLGLGTTLTNPLPKYIVTNFATPVNVKKPFFLGYTLPSGYDWTSANGDTIAIAASGQNAAGGDYTYYNNLHNNYYKIKTTGAGAHSVFLSINAYYDPNSTPAGWHDFGQNAGLLTTLDIMPIVQYWDDGVNGLVKNDLTFYGTHPNPATNGTNIKFSLANETDVTINIMDMNGRVLNTITKNNLGAGDHLIPVETANLAAGEYLYSIQTKNGGAFASQFTVIR